MVASLESEKQASGPSRPPKQPLGLSSAPAFDQSDLLDRHLGNGYIQRAELHGQRDDEEEREGSCCGTCSRLPVQAKVAVGPSADPYEQEAERVADHVLRLPEPSVSGDSSVRAPLIQPRRFSDAPSRASREQPSVEIPAGTGQPLAASTRRFMEPRFVANFGDVRIHDDPGAQQTAAQIHARAFTYQHDIYLGRGESEHDERLMAHELTHVVQQRGGTDAQSSGAVRGPVAAQTIQRAISPALDKLESLLSYGIFDWAITDSEAIEALKILESLSRYEQAVFFSDQKYVDRLIDNLPAGRQNELSSIQSGVASILPPTAVVDDINSKLSYGLFDWAITDKDASQALDLLKKLTGVPLATALGAVDTSRLMDNLPDNRKGELTALMATAFGTGGARQTEEEQNPAAVISSLKFTSDYGSGGTHGAIKNNASDWSNSGAFYGKPEWFTSGDKVFSFPVAQQKNTSVQLEAALNILPANAPAAPIRLTGRSNESALNFDFAGTMHGGPNQKVTLTSVGKLPDEIAAMENKSITWNLEWRNWKRDIGTTNHSIFVTIAPPSRPDEVTLKRMRTAVNLTGQVHTTDPHPLVRGIMQRWGAYNLDVVYSNEWDMADNLDVGAQCIDIVRFVNSLLSTVGCPGTATAVVIWAKPDSPRLPQEDIYPHGGEATVPNHPSHSDWGVALIDANGCPNNFEAALKFEYNGALLYYPGGVPLDRDYATPTDVLFIFQCLAWVTGVAKKQWIIQSILTTYPGGSCSTGALTCH
jgi:hypothetical protein